MLHEIYQFFFGISSKSPVANTNITIYMVTEQHGHVYLVGLYAPYLLRICSKNIFHPFPRIKLFIFIHKFVEIAGFKIHSFPPFSRGDNSFNSTVKEEGKITTVPSLFSIFLKKRRKNRNFCSMSGVEPYWFIGILSFIQFIREAAKKKFFF